MKRFEVRVAVYVIAENEDDAAELVANGTILSDPAVDGKIDAYEVFCVEELED